MPHMVVFKTSEGKPGYHLTEGLDEAVRFVEHLRNNEQVTDSRVFRMHEIPIEFKVLYKVEVSAASEDAAGGSGTSGGGESPLARKAAEVAGVGAKADRTATANSDGGGSFSADSSLAGSGPSMSADLTQRPPAQKAETGGRFGLFARQ